MRSLNSRHRKKNKATDVLSFPSSPTNDSGRRSVAGEIALSAEIARQNASKLGHSAADEVKILALHGLLHLAGYDHESDSGEMARTEENLRRMLNLPAGLIGRKGDLPSARSRGKAVSVPSAKPVKRRRGR